MRPRRLVSQAPHNCQEGAPDSALKGDRLCLSSLFLGKCSQDCGRINPRAEVWSTSRLSLGAGRKAGERNKTEDSKETRG